VQQPAGGMPDWAKIGLGAVLAILTSLMVELFRPSVAKMRLKGLINRHVRPELLHNMATVESSYKFLSSIAPALNTETKVNVSRRMLRALRSERYDHYFASETATMFELDKDQLLRDFYGSMLQLKLALTFRDKRIGLLQNWACGCARLSTLDMNTFQRIS
jgi:hypothetical protein